MEIATPLYGKLDKTVYEPSEDTFLLLDALLKDRISIETIKPDIIIEIGSGSGVVTSFIQTLVKKLLPNHHFIQFATDLNINALNATINTAILNKQRIPEVVQCDLISSIEERLVNSVDILIFNPPYVPTEHLPMTLTESCYAGGPNGRAALDNLIPRISKILSPKGCFYLIALKSNNIPEITSNANIFNLAGEIIMERRCGHEYLYVLKFTKKNFSIKNK